jgi:hypothetical protein
VSTETPILSEASVKFGRNESPLGYPTARLRTFMSSAVLPPPPKSGTFADRISKFPTMLNDTYGDCVIAGQGHHIQIATCYGAGKEVVIPDSVVKQTYFTQTGGRDNGLNIPMSLDYWVKHPIAGQKLLAWAACDVRDPVEQMQCLSWFGSGYYGVTLPFRYLDAINQKRPWEDISQPRNPKAGHCVLSVAYNEIGPIFATWGLLQQATWKWVAKYGDECIALITPEWMSQVVTPGGLDLASMLEYFQSLTGKKPPVPENPPEIDWSKL